MTQWESKQKANGQKLETELSTYKEEVTRFVKETAESVKRDAEKAH